MPQLFLSNLNNNSSKKIFLTGSTGLLGTQLLKVFLENTNFKIFLLIRAANQNLAEDRLEKILKHKDLYNLAYLKRITVLCGDHTEVNFGLPLGQYEYLTTEINEVFHSAALAEFRRPLEDVRFVNVEGTKNVLNFARKCKNFEKVNYISTAFISGNFKGEFLESDLNVGQDFNNTYEQSKYETEVMIQKSFQDIKLITYRPSIIVGEYATGYTNNFRMFYQPFRSISLGVIDTIPINFSTQLNIIPCDFAAQVIFALSISSGLHEVYHVVAPETVSIMHLMKFSANHFKYKEPDYVSSEEFEIKLLTPIQRKIIEPYMPYFNFRALFGCKNTFEMLELMNFKYPSINDEYLFRLFNYCKAEGYIT